MAAVSALIHVFWCKMNLIYRKGKARSNGSSLLSLCGAKPSRGSWAANAFCAHSGLLLLGVFSESTTHPPGDAVELACVETARLVASGEQ
jgi:hypothetical protein